MLLFLILRSIRWVIRIIWWARFTSLPLQLFSILSQSSSPIICHLLLFLITSVVISMSICIWRGCVLIVLVVYRISESSISWSLCFGLIHCRCESSHQARCAQVVSVAYRSQIWALLPSRMRDCQIICARWRLLIVVVLLLLLMPIEIGRIWSILTSFISIFLI